MKKQTQPLSFQLSNTYRRLPKRFYMNAQPAVFPDPEIIVFNENLAKELGVREEIGLMSREQQAALFSGNIFPQGAEPISQAYGGHQFGYYAILGDGRAILLGERMDPAGKRFDIQLKGSGHTAYSRGGDGRALVGPMLREYLISEAMAGLGIPTTRSLAVVLTGEKVYRNGFGAGAVLTRTAASHLRVGTFQFAYPGGADEIRLLADYAIERHYPFLLSREGEEEFHTYKAFLGEVVEKQAELIAKWQLVGFIHGVMNTDNMTISGETIDYGPCAFMDEFDPATVFSSIDQGGRYRYENQPSIGQWNLSRFADALLPILDERQELAIAWATDELVRFAPKYQSVWLTGMKQKLGMSGEHPADKEIIAELLGLMQEHRADYTNTFVRLSLEADAQDGSYLQGTETLFSDSKFDAWKTVWQARQELSGLDRQTISEGMKKANPFVIPRNFRVEEALSDAAEGDYRKLQELSAVLQDPYEYSEDKRRFQELPPEPTTGYKTYCGT